MRYDRFQTRTNDWLTQDFTEILSGENVKLGSKYAGKKLQPQGEVDKTLMAVVDDMLRQVRGFVTDYLA
jgi:hypothetical protein